MNLTVEMLDTAFEQGRKASQARAWDSNVDPEIVGVMKLLGESPTAKGYSHGALALVAMHMMTIPRGKAQNVAEKLMDDDPLKYPMADMFLAGFVLGKRVQEIKRLEELAGCTGE